MHTSKNSKDIFFSLKNYHRFIVHLGSHKSKRIIPTVPTVAKFMACLCDCIGTLFFNCD